MAGQLAQATSVAPLAAAGMARLLATAALTVFPHDAHAEPVGPTPATRPRSPSAAAWPTDIEAHADQDVSVADIAGAAGVTPRALQYAFRWHVGTTPLGHLRTVRLDLVHRDLPAAPRSGRTVTQQAGRWGFWHPGRFAAQYRAV